MKVVLPTNGDRVSPLLDAAKNFVLVATASDGTRSRKELVIDVTDSIGKAKRIGELGADVLICGAISWPLEVMVTSAGTRVIPNTCGFLDEVVDAYFAGELTEHAFLSPGCPGRQHRRCHRHGRRWRNGW